MDSAQASEWSCGGFIDPDTGVRRASWPSVNVAENLESIGESPCAHLEGASEDKLGWEALLSLEEEAGEGTK